MSTGGQVSTRLRSACASSCSIQDAPALLGQAEEKTVLRMPTPTTDHTPPSISFPPGSRAPALPDDLNVISGRALLGGAQRERELARTVDDELRELDDTESPRSSRPTIKIIEPEQSAKVLLVGSGFAMEDALVEALERLGSKLHWVTPEDAVEAVVITSPDLIVLAGDAAENTGKRVLDVLRHSPIGSAVPVAVLSGEPTLDQRLEAYSNGAAAFVPETASADETAREIFALASQLTRQARPDAVGTETVLSDLLRALSRKVRLALTANAPTSGDESVALVMHTERDVARLIDGFVTRLSGHVTRSKNVDYELGGVAAGAELLGLPRAEMSSISDIAGVRVLVVDDHPARADALAQELRARGATVVIGDLEPSPQRFEQLRQFDPVVIVMGHVHAEREGSGFLRRARADLRLRWATVRTIDWDEMALGGNALEHLLGTLAAASAPELRVQEQVKFEPCFDIRLETIGPARLLKALAGLPFATRLTLHNRRMRLQADVARALLVGATGEAYENEATVDLVGTAALAAFLVVGSGRVHVERVTHPSVVNVMSPLDLALGMAEAEAAPIAPSRVLPFAEDSVPDHAEPVVSRPSPEPPVTISVVELPDSVPAPPAPPEASRGRRWNAVALVACVVVVGFILFDSWRMRRTASGAPVPSVAASVLAPPPPVAAPSLIERAERGEPQALAELAARPEAERSVEQHLALSRGRVAERRLTLARLGEEIQKRPELGLSAETTRRLRRDATDPELYAEALRVAAALPGPLAGDLLYDVWVRTTERTPATELAERLVYTERVRERASAPLRLALELRKVDECDKLLPMLARVREEGDRRSFQLLARLSERGGSCPQGSGDCYSCMRGTPELRRAIAASAERAPPSFE